VTHNSSGNTLGGLGPPIFRLSLCFFTRSPMAHATNASAATTVATHLQTISGNTTTSGNNNKSCKPMFTWIFLVLMHSGNKTTTNPPPHDRYMPKRLRQWPRRPHMTSTPPHVPCNLGLQGAFCSQHVWPQNNKTDARRICDRCKRPTNA
jgi:hypothetical protein